MSAHAPIHAATMGHFGDDDPFDLCDVCGVEPLGKNNTTGLCRKSAQAARRERENPVDLSHLRLVRHKIAVWWEHGPPPVDPLRSLCAHWDWEVRHALQSARQGVAVGEREAA